MHGRPPFHFYCILSKLAVSLQIRSLRAMWKVSGVTATQPSVWVQHICAGRRGEEDATVSCRLLGGLTMPGTGAFII